jgi:hypothetical protein
MLDYYRGDYKPIGQQQYSINSFNGPAAVATTNFRDLFNGMILEKLRFPLSHGEQQTQDISIFGI